jgi:hypothetical protein
MESDRKMLPLPIFGIDDAGNYHAPNKRQYERVILPMAVEIERLRRGVRDAHERVMTIRQSIDALPDGMPKAALADIEARLKRLEHDDAT